MRLDLFLEADDPGISDRYRGITAATEAALTVRLESAIASGQLSSKVQPATVAETIVGAMLYRILTRREITATFTSELLNVIFTGH